MRRRDTLEKQQEQMRRRSVRRKSSGTRSKSVFSTSQPERYPEQEPGISDGISTLLRRTLDQVLALKAQVSQLNSAVEERDRRDYDRDSLHAFGAALTGLLVPRNNDSARVAALEAFLRTPHSSPEEFGSSLGKLICTGNDDWTVMDECLRGILDLSWER